VALYGNYETVRQIAEGPLTSVWEARRADAKEDEPPRFALKLIAPATTFLGPEGRGFDLRPFLVAADTQAKAAVRGSHWAPVHESGQSAGSAFYVTDRFKLSLKELLDTNARLTPAALHNVFSSAVRGLLELYETANRPHGNLKPTNILLDGIGARDRVALTDPASPDELGKGTSFATDLRALGTMLYQLVTGRPFVAKDCWPIGPSPEWNHYGDAWRGLCSRLLAPDMAAGAAELQAVAEELARLRPRAAGKGVLYAAIGLLAAAGITAGAHFGWRELTRLARPSPPPVPDLESEISEWLGEIRRADKVRRSAAINAEWRKRRDALLPPGITAPRLASDPKRYQALRQELGRLRDFLSALDDEETLPLSLPESRPGVPEGPLRNGVAKAVLAKREATLEAILQKVPWDDSGTPTCAADAFKQTPAWKKATESFRGWRDSAAKALNLCLEVASVLRQGWLPDATPPGRDHSLVELLAEWSKLDVPTELGVVFQPTVERARALVKVTELDRQGLLDWLESPDPRAPPQAKLLVWRRLGEFDDWPKTLEDLRREADLEKQVRDIANQIENKEAVRWVEKTLRAESSRRWEKVFNALALKQPPGDFNDKDLVAAEAIRREITLPEDQLASTTRLRLAIFRLRHSLVNPQQDVSKAARSFLDELSKLPEKVTGNKEIAAVVTAIERAIDESPNTDPAKLFASVGPASGKMGIRWSIHISADGQSVSYTWPGTGYKIVFLPVRVAGQKKATYLSTTEVPLGLFIHAVTAAKAWKTMESMLAERPEGPCAWHWTSADGERRLRRAERWLEGFRYAPNIPRTLPSENHPVQQVSPAAAIYFTWLLGCRLPRAAEWKAAAKAASAGQRPNLRDQTWAKQQDFLRQLPGKPASWPDAGIFWPLGVPGKTGPAAQPLAPDDDDQTLWFQPVGSGERFTHLVGNVAEFLLEMPADEQRTLAQEVNSFPEEVRGPFLRAALLQKLEKNPNLVQVVGGSALSAPEVWDGKKNPFDTPRPVRERVAERRGFSDVGFRLAFTAPGEPLSLALRRVLASKGYLPGLQQ